MGSTSSSSKRLLEIGPPATDNETCLGVEVSVLGSADIAIVVVENEVPVAEDEKTRS
jgi:hypothetical protein